MKKLSKEKIIFVVFYLVLLVVNLLLVSIQNYDNIILQNEYDFKEENNMDVNLEYYQMLDNKSKIENSEEFISKTTKVIVIPSLVFLILMLCIDFDKIKIQNVFLSVGLVLGIMYIFIVPIGGVPDEQVHWYRAYEVSLGHLKSDKNEEGYGGRVLPSKVKGVITLDNSSESQVGQNYIFEDSIKDLDIRYEESKKLDESKTEFVEFSNTALYPAVSYLPQAAGIAITRIFTDSMRVQAYAARIVNFLVYMTIMYYAIKILPKKKSLLFLIAFLPVCVQQSASMSLDGLVMATATLLIAYTLSLIYPENNDRKINIKDMIILGVCSIVVSITKVIYLPLVLILLLIPKERFKNNKQKYLIVCLIILLATICDLLVITGSFEYKNRIARFGADTKVQIIDGIIKNPVQFAKVSLATIKKYGVTHVLEIFGNGLCWLDVNISPVYVFTLLVLMVNEILVNKKDKNEGTDSELVEERKDEYIEIKKLKINKELFIKVFLGCVFLILVLAIFVTEYATINAVGSLYIDGIQGRYYIPMLLLLGVVFTNDVIFIKNNKQLPKMYLFMFLIFVNLHALTYIMFKYL